MQKNFRKYSNGLQMPVAKQNELNEFCTKQKEV